MVDTITPQQKEAYDYHERAKTLIHQEKYSFWQLVATLKVIKEKKLYRHLGDGGYDTWRSYLNDPDLQIGKSVQMVDKYIDIYNYYIGELKLKEEYIFEIPVHKLDFLKSKLPKMKEEERAEVLAKAMSLSFSDFQKEMIEAGMKQKPKIRITHCSKCGKLEVYYEQGEICICKGVTAFYANPIIEDEKPEKNTKKKS